MPIALVAFEFDPFLRLGDRLVRLETLALAGGILGSLLLAALIARRTPAVAGGGPDVEPEPLRLDDLVFVVLAALPGAVLGGRLGYALLHLDYYGAHPATLVDPGQGSLHLGVGIMGAALTGGSAARLLSRQPGRWFHVAAIPLLVAIAAGKAALALGGSGQGQPSDLPWATSYGGLGPWGSLAPGLPSHPAQLYEAALTVGVLVAILGLRRMGWLSQKDGRLFLAALGGWAIVRVIVATTWRDPTVLGPLKADQLISLAIAGACAVLLLGPSRIVLAGRAIRREGVS